MAWVYLVLGSFLLKYEFTAGINALTPEGWPKDSVYKGCERSFDM